MKQAANGQTDQREMYDPCAGERALQVRPIVVMPPGARLVGARTYGEPAPQSSAAASFHVKQRLAVDNAGAGL